MPKFKFKTLDIIKGTGAGLLSGLVGLLVGGVANTQGFTTITGPVWATICFAFGFAAVIIESQEEKE